MKSNNGYSFIDKSIFCKMRQEILAGILKENTQNVKLVGVEHMEKVLFKDYLHYLIKVVLN